MRSASRPRSFRFLSIMTIGCGLSDVRPELTVSAEIRSPGGERYLEIETGARPDPVCANVQTGRHRQDRLFDRDSSRFECGSICGGSTSSVAWYSSS